MRRRQFLIGAGMVACSGLAAKGIARVGFLIPFQNIDREVQNRVTALKEELQDLGWQSDSTLEIREFWPGDDLDKIMRSSKELALWAPDCIVAIGGRVIPVVLKLAPGVPIIVPGASDPVGVGWVKSLARPGGMISGVTQIESSVFGKMMSLLSRTAPTRKRAYMVYNSDNPSTESFYGWFETACNDLQIVPMKCPLSKPTIVDTIQASASTDSLFFFCNDVTTASAFQAVDNAVLASGVPAIFADPPHVAGGGMLIYSADRVSLARKAAHYVDRVLKGERVGDLPFEQPNSYKLVVNMKTAKMMGVNIPDDIVALADEVIE